MRCTACGARNSDDAVWCTQCYADVSGRGDSAATNDPTQRPSARTEPTPEPLAPEPAISQRSAHRGAGPARDVRESGGEVQWRCRACDGWSPLTASSCVVCGTDRQGFGDPVAPTVRADISGTGIVVASLVLPGLGHLLGGRHGTGAARAMLALLWLVGGVALVLGSPGLSALPGWVLLAGAAVLWVVTALDARSLVAGRDVELLGTRRFAALVLAVTVGLVLSAVVVLLAGR